MHKPVPSLFSWQLLACVVGWLQFVPSIVGYHPIVLQSVAKVYETYICTGYYKILKLSKQGKGTKHPLMKSKNESSIMYVTAIYSGKSGFRGGKVLSEKIKHKYVLLKIHTFTMHMHSDATRKSIGLTFCIANREGM